jgi:hypothetical protein
MQEGSRTIAQTAVQRWMGVQKVAEYIDKALLKELLERYGCDKDLLEIVDCIPADADVMQVVRCKDCKYLANATVNSNGFLICNVSDMEITLEDFCSYGEKMDRGEENGRICP